MCLHKVGNDTSSKINHKPKNSLFLSLSLSLFLSLSNIVANHILEARFIFIVPKEEGVAEKANRTHPVSFESPPSPTEPMGSHLRRVFNRISGFVSPWRRNQAPHGRRIFHREVQQEEFQYPSNSCLSSYYSVFVARLAIMVGGNFLCTLV